VCVCVCVCEFDLSHNSLRTSCNVTLCEFIDSISTLEKTVL